MKTTTTTITKEKNNDDDKETINNSGNNEQLSMSILSTEEELQSTVTAIFDSAFSSLHKIIQEEVSTLPFLDEEEDEEEVTASAVQDKSHSNSSSITNGANGEKSGLSGRQKLYRMVTKVYDNYLDITQSYAEHEIFTIPTRKFSKKKRDLLYQRYQQLWNERTSGGSGNGGDDDGENQKEKENVSQGPDNDDDDDDDDDDTAVDSSESRVTEYTLPESLSDVPTDEQMKALDDEIHTLRNKLQDLNVQQLDYQAQLKSIHRTQEVAHEMNEIIAKQQARNDDDDDNNPNNGSSSSSKSMVDKSIQNVLVGKNELQQLCNDGKEIIQQLDDIKTERDHNNNSNNDGENQNDTKEFSERVKRAFQNKTQQQRSNKKLTMEEDYQERLKSQKSLGNNGTTSFASKLCQKKEGE